MEVKYPHRNIEEVYSLPITFHYINGVKGEWKFKVPIKQEKYRKLYINMEKMYTDEGAGFRIEEIISAKTSATIIIETVTENRNVAISIEKAVNDNGNIYHFSDVSSLTFYASVFSGSFEKELDPFTVKITD